jgi:hypothetical protein
LFSLDVLIAALNMLLDLLVRGRGTGRDEKKNQAER